MHKRVYLTRNDVLLIVGAIAFLMFVTLIAESWIGEAAFGVALWLAVLIVLLGLVETFRRVRSDLQKTNENIRQDYNQLESLFSLFFTLGPNAPLPETRAWTASPDLLKKITETVYREKPFLVVELGGGVSTLVIAYCLERLGQGRVVSLEHEPKYAAIHQEMILLHGLENVATIVHAPLQEISLRGKKWRWYDLDSLNFERPIDFLFIDGPPAAPRTLARYPALPLLFDQLRDGATVLLDDGKRRDEQETVELWRQEFAALSCEFLDLEKGAFMMRKGKN